MARTKKEEKIVKKSEAQKIREMDVATIEKTIEELKQELFKKPLAMRQGGGKGNVEGYVAVVKKGTIMFEVAGVSKEVAREAFRLAANKLPITAKLVAKESE